MAQADSVVIAPGETVRFSAQFSPNILLTHLKTGVVVTDRRVIVRRPNTVLGLIPLGFTDSTSPLDQVTEVTATETVSGRKLVSGLFNLFIALILFINEDFIGFTGEQSVLLGMILIGVALYLFATAYRIGLIFRNQGAGELLARTARGERRELEASKAQIDVLLYGDASTGPATGPFLPAPPTQAVLPAPSTQAELPVASAPTVSIRKGDASPAVAVAPPVAPPPAAAAPIASPVQAPAAVAPQPTPPPAAPVALPQATASGYTAAQASDLSTPQLVLSKIAELEPSLRPLVAANPNAYPGLLQWLGSLGDPAVDHALRTRAGSVRQ